LCIWAVGSRLGHEYQTLLGFVYGLRVKYSNLVVDLLKF
jgi:hypothetical protein